MSKRGKQHSSPRRSNPPMSPVASTPRTPWQPVASTPHPSQTVVKSRSSRLRGIVWIGGICCVIILFVLAFSTNSLSNPVLNIIFVIIMLLILSLMIPNRQTLFKFTSVQEKYGFWKSLFNSPKAATILPIITWLFLISIVILIFHAFGELSLVSVSIALPLIAIVVTLLQVPNHGQAFRNAIQGFLAVLFWSVAGLIKYRQGIWNGITIGVVFILLMVSFFGNWIENYAYSLCLGSLGWSLTCNDPLSTELFFAPDPHNPVSGSFVTIGIVDEGNTSVFDPSRVNNEEKDILSKIFQENRKYSKQTHMDVVVVTTLSQTPDDLRESYSVGIEDLRGVYLAMKRYNEKNTHTIKLRLLIANIGTLEAANTTVPRVMDQILLLSHQDTSLRGIIGLPFSQATSKAIHGDWSVYHSNIPMVSPSATSNDFSNTALFYRISSSDTQQACSIVNEIINGLEPIYKRIDPNHNSQFTIALFYEDNANGRGDAYSFSLKQSIQGVLNKDPRYNPSSAPCFGSTDIQVRLEQITLSDPSTYGAAITDAVSHKTDMIFFAGYASDLNLFETQLAEVQGNQHQTYRIPIIGGDGVFDIAGNITNSYSRVYSTTYASPVNDHSKNLSELYNATFGSPQNEHVSPLLPPHAILSYDAATAFLVTLDNSISSSNQLPGQDDFNQVLAKVDFVGASGDIQLQGTATLDRSNPVNKPIYIMCEDTSFHMQEVAEYDPGHNAQNFLKDIINCQL